MKIIVNGETIETQKNTLADLLIELERAEDRIATAVNKTFVPAKARDTLKLLPGDRVEIVAPRQGG